ncbi:CUB and sushi domain-containing protein 1-like [Mercenaria mercenaria]|uniref:CUB and sushi domain-containing protein 1-like n=1 Tax=Mercenaria mercenaria TaxID=6596 RepID=UPI00234EF345|nr:CUB and sushi domain-containing protein 1-like [Mercenaria mercenaria]
MSNDLFRMSKTFKLHRLFILLIICGKGIYTYYVCGDSGYHTQNNGEIVSHSEFYNGQNYSDDWSCIFKMEAPMDMKITLVANTFDLEAETSCGHDSLEVYDGNSVQSPSLGKYCNGSPLCTISSTHRFLTIRFKSDSQVTGHGFDLHYYFMDTVSPNGIMCVNSSSITKNNGEIISHYGFHNGQTYSNYMNCTSRIEAPSDMKITLFARTFDLEAEPSCGFDSLEVYDGSSVKSPSLGKYCNGSPLCTISSTQQFLTIQFITDHSVLGRGFDLHYYFTSIVLHCNSLPDPINGGLAYGNSTDINSTATIYCNEGFRLNGSDYTRCENGYWIPDPDIMCTLIECTYPVAPENGYVIKSGISVNSTAQFMCYDGYDMKGVQFSICLSDGNWSSQSPLCLPKECPRITDPDHGSLKLSNNFWYQSVGRFTCNSGYTLVGSNVTKCLSSVNWTYPVPKCSPVDCGNWTYLNNTWENYSYITYMTNTTYRATAISFCKAGYHIDGNKKSLAATCLANGTWSIASPPLCVQVGCPVFNISKGDIKVEYSHGSTRPVNSTATFSCKNASYSINGFEKVTCLSTGEWTGLSPSCTKVQNHISPCPTTIDLHGTQWEETQPGRIKTKHCPVTENYVGEIFRKCKGEGKWMLPIYNCVRQDIAIVDQQIEAIKENPSEEVVTNALDKLNSITQPSEQNTIFGGEIDKVTSILESIADISGKIEVTDDQAEAFLDTTSNLLDTSNTETWKAMSQEPEGGDTRKTERGASKVLDVVSRYSDSVTASLSKSNATSKTVNASNLVLHVSKINNETDGVTFPEMGKSHEFNLSSSFHLPKESLQGLKHVSSILYKNLSEILHSRTVSNGSEDDNTEINSAVVAVKLENWKENAGFHISLTLGHFEDKFSSRQCSFWNENLTAWDSEGCILNTSASSSSTSVCECNHLTNFAILMSPLTQTNVDSKAIDIISTVGCSISMLALVITILVHVALWNYVKSDKVVLLINLSIALVISYAVFLGGVDRTDNEETCTAIAAILQYIYLVVFFLMLAEGIEISVKFLYVFTTESRLKWMLPCAWLIPALIVGISLGATRLRGYGNEQFCWLSVQGGLIWAFVVPAMIIIVVNFVLLVILRAAFGSTSQLQKSKIEQTK